MKAFHALLWESDRRTLIASERGKDRNNDNSGSTRGERMSKEEGATVKRSISSAGLLVWCPLYKSMLPCTDFRR